MQAALVCFAETVVKICHVSLEPENGIYAALQSSVIITQNTKAKHAVSVTSKKAIHHRGVRPGDRLRADCGECDAAPLLSSILTSVKGIPL